ncbi:MAG: low molecular weight protein-tyrosine-phosphatase [Phycisphaerales bacterium]
MTAPANQIPAPTPTGVLFVCLGNICRSPLAEGVFLHLARERDAQARFRVDSCGTGGWHAGEPADGRAQAVAKRHGVTLPSRARRLDAPADFERFHLIVPMDRSNLRDLLDEGAPAERTRLLRSWDPALIGADERDLDVPDPYYGGADGFDTVFRMVHAACAALLDDLLREPLTPR